MEASVCRFGVLGPLLLHRDGEQVPLPSGHPRSLLALFLMAGGVPLSRDRLIDELWGERPPASAVSALHVHLSKLRDLLGALVVRDAGGYALQSGVFELDSWRFDELINEARNEPERARALVTEALALVRGEPLADVSCEGSIAQWRRALEEKYLQALLLRVDCDLGAGAAAELIPELELLASEHRFEERLWGQLMLALYRSGRQADALDAFARARRAFASELGLEPGEQLARLHNRMLERDASLLLEGAAEALGTDSAAAHRPAATPPRPPSNLPSPPTRLVGRESELAVLQGLFADADVRLVTLVGPGGVGKTRMEIELARRIESQFGDGVVFVRLERLTDAALVPTEISTAIGRREGGEGPGADGLGRYLQARELLLVLDNFEHLMPAAVMVAELIEQAPKIRLLVSSRAPLRIRGERVFIVQPLELPSSDAEDEIARSTAVQMFMQSALAANSELELDPQATRTIAAICGQLDGLPLALELAASRSQLLTLPQILEQLSRPLAIGERALRDLPDRQQTLGATIAWSYELLSEPAQEALRAGGTFLGGFTLATLEAVLVRPALAELDELREASLVRPRPAGRFEMLALVRAFAEQALDESGDAEAVRERHRHYFAAFASPARDRIESGTAFAEVAEPLWIEHANLRTAFSSAIVAGDEETALTLALAMQALWLSGNLKLEAMETATRILDTFSIPPKDELALLKVVSALEWGNLGWHLRFVQRAEELGDAEALAIATVQMHSEVIAVDRAEMARIHPILLGLLESDLGPRTLGWVNFSLFGDAFATGTYEEALEHGVATVRLAKEIGYEYMLACGLLARLLARSALERRITQPDLAEVMELGSRIGIHSVGTAALQFVARYAAEVDPDAGRRWLAVSERIIIEYDTGRSLEDVLREETIEVLEITDLDALIAQTPPVEAVAALAEAAAWIAARPPDESAPREVIARVRFEDET